MGTIHFVSGLESLTLKALKDAEDCADILKDLGRIKYTIAHGSEQEARALDYELQQKYPAIVQCSKPPTTYKQHGYLCVLQQLKVAHPRNQICSRITGGLFVMRQSKRGSKSAWRIALTTLNIPEQLQHMP